MLNQIKDKPLSQLIAELQQKYQEDNDQSNIFQQIYQKQLEQESSTDSSHFLPALLSGSTGSQSSNSQEDNQEQACSKVQKNIKKEKKNKKTGKVSQDDKQEFTQIPDKKAMQMIRNRISAQNSRDRKKAYLQKLEEDFVNQSAQLSEMHGQVIQLQQQLEEAQKINQQLQQQYTFLTCLNCGSKHFGYDDENPISVSKNKSLGKLGLSFLFIIAIIGCIAIDLNPQTQKLNTIQSYQLHGNQIRNLNASDDQFRLFDHVSQSRIKGMTDIMEYNSEYNYKFFDTTYRAILNSEESLVNGLINFNKERAKTNNGKALAPLNYHQPQVDSLFCPSIYKYENQTQGIRVHYQDNQWLHLIIPKNKVNIFYQTTDNSIVLKESFADSKTEHRQVYQEIWCQIKSVSDFYI
ncbi:unnamed protein product (macronuclear) [Paramecium tetraurelia]|uniref:BZIP domain-containing protein n=1 Tax=Paramecium tetraurelia TaxID=5888 RepID=A0D7S2_PARTE|nr:uncharacterized protein GSPATT00014056001 [Paramecium tetraurelia]CAK79089.1 unnamed protein product [Paramecium tetraurelia]|eukprot:XP_001446486.1 hypothetical protein (macronuclear) [Paramecium tetraurelia strain d4-2]